MHQPSISNNSRKLVETIIKVEWLKKKIPTENPRETLYLLYQSSPNNRYKQNKIGYNVVLNHLRDTEIVFYNNLIMFLFFCNIFTIKKNSMKKLQQHCDDTTWVDCSADCCCFYIFCVIAY